MKIVHLIFSFNVGGIENLLVDTINHWPEDDEIRLIIINDSKDAELISRIHQNQNKQVLCMGRQPGGKKLAYLLNLAKQLKAFSPDVIHCHGNSEFQFLLPLKLLHTKWKIFLTIHSTKVYLQYSNRDVTLQKRFLNKIIAISEAVKKDILARNIPENQIEVVYNGVSKERFTALHQNYTEKTLICVARLVPQLKGQDLLIKAVGLLRDQGKRVNCLLVGQAPDDHPEYRESLELLVNSLNLEDRVKFLGNRSDVPQLLASSDAFVLPSRLEGFGLVVIEAMMAGIPVIASNVDGPAEILCGGQYGYLAKPEDPAHLAACIQKCLEENTSDLVNRAREYAISTFSISAAVEHLTRLYHSCPIQKEKNGERR